MFPLTEGAYADSSLNAGAGEKRVSWDAVSASWTKGDKCILIVSRVVGE